MTGFDKLARARGRNGFDIAETAKLLRRYVVIEQELVRMLAGWFIAAPRYETKYALAYHLLDHAEHVQWLRQRLDEMRGGQVRSSVEPQLAQAVAATIHAPDADAFIAGAYLELKSALLATYEAHVSTADPSANAVELRILRRMIADLRTHLCWAREQKNIDSADSWRTQIRQRLAAIGGLSGLEPADASAPVASPTVDFRRPTTIVLDDRIHIGELMHDDQRRSADATTTTREDFKVFFNELYAACMLASILYDADPIEMPWEFLHDVARHFWDEARHSEFGAVRLRELGAEPSVCNPVLFERSQSLPVMHRFCYLTLGLEVYFMPRKRPRVRKYADLGDARSQLFADQDWNDETLHVTFGKKWMGHFLANDFRSTQDVLDEVRQHMETVTGQAQAAIAAPF